MPEKAELQPPFWGSKHGCGNKLSVCGTKVDHTYDYIAALMTCPSEGGPEINLDPEKMDSFIPTFFAVGRVQALGVWLSLTSVAHILTFWFSHFGPYSVMAVKG